jgi:cytochrome c oxidase subunit II
MSLRLGLSVLGLPFVTGAAFAKDWQVHDWQTGMQAPVTPVMERLTQFHTELVWIVVAICLLVAGLLVYVMVRFNHRAHPVPSKTHHNTALEVMWTLVPVIILVVIAIPSFKLLYFQADIPKPDVTIQAIGHQWYWTYAYTKEGGFQFDANMLQDAAAKKAGKPRLLGTDNPLVVPVNKNVEIITTGADVIHSWAVPAFGVKMDAIPGRLNHTWFRATREGTYYGQCSELCGANHAFMPIEVKVVSEAAYRAWLAEAKQKYAADDVQRVASN